MAEDFARRGARVEVVTTWPHYPQWQRADDARNRWSSEVLNGVNVHRVPGYIPSEPSLARRGVYEGSYVAAASPLVSRIKPDVVVGCMPSLFAGVLAANVARRRRVRLVQVVQDLVSSAAAQSGMSGAARAQGTLRRLESYALRRADAVTAAASSFVPTMAKLGVDRERIHVVPNWSQVTPAEVDRDAVRHRLGWADRTVVLHTGNVGLKQNLDALAPRICELAVTDPDLLFVFMGDGNQRQALSDALGRTPNALIVPPVADEDYPETLAAADVLLLHERDTVTDMSLPSKLTSYFGVGRPVLAITRPDSASTLEMGRAGGGMCLAQPTTEELAEAIRELAGPPGTSLGRAAQDYHAEHLSPGASLGKLAELVLA